MCSNIFYNSFKRNISGSVVAMMMRVDQARNDEYVIGEDVAERFAADVVAGATV